MSPLQLQWRRDTAAAWTAANPILAEGETGYEKVTKQFKMGDGVTAWNSLPYGGIQGPQGIPGTAGTNGTSPNAFTTITGNSGTATADAANDNLQITGNAPLNFVATDGPEVITGSISAASASGTGSMSAAGFKKQRDQYTDVVNDLGADPTGSVDATGLINTWIGTLANSGVLFIPASVRIRIDGPVNMTKEVRVVGAERRTSIIGTGSATNTQFDVTGDACVFENLRFEAGTTAQNLALRSAGYCVDIDATSNGSGMYRVDVIGHWSAFNLEGQLPFVDDCSIREYGALAGNGQCIRVNTPGAGGDTIIRRVLTDNGSNITGWAGIRVISCASLVIESCNIIHTTVGLAIEPPNAGTVPSLKVTNTFFDTGTHGVRFNPTGTGVWYRSEFVNCWFGSNTVAGVQFVSAQFDGIVFTNCDFLGNPVGIDANAGGGSWTLNGGCQIAGSSTAGIRLAASAGHFPVIQGNRIKPQAVGGAFGVNAVGIIVGAGAYLGLVIQGNDVSQNTTALTLGAVTITGGAALDYQRYRITDNAAINPRGAVTIPGVPASAAVVINTTGFRVQVIWKVGTANASVTINGVLYTVATVAAAVMSVTLEPGGTFSFATGTITSWTWVGQ